MSLLTGAGGIPLPACPTPRITYNHALGGILKPLRKVDIMYNQNVGHLGERLVSFQQRRDVEFKEFDPLEHPRDDFDPFILKKW